MFVINTYVPLIKKEGTENGYDSGVQLYFPDDKFLIQPLLFSKYLREKLEGPICMTTQVQKARGPQKYI